MAVLFAGSMFATSYTVVGGSAAIFGETWKPDNTANDMVADGNVFKFVKSDVKLSAGTIEYKIVEDHAWTKSYPQVGNASFNIAQDGKYDVTFTLDLSANPEYSVVAELKEEVVIEHTASIKGGWDSWAAEVAFTLSDDKLTASAKKEFSAGTYEFKAIIDGDSWRSNGGSITRAAASATLPGNNDANMKLDADVAGEYVFTWTFATNTLVVTFPEGGGSVDPEQPKFYVTGNDALVGEALAWHANAIPSMGDTLVLELKADVDYLLKVSLNGTWEGENNVKGYNELSEKTEGLKDISNDHNIGFRLNESGDVKVIYTAEVFKLEGDFYVAPALNLEDGYYLIGLDAAEWNVENIKPEHLFSVNPENEKEYTLDITLVENQEFKVVKVENEAIVTWYPDGYDNNYIVGANYAGEKTVYFRPDGNGGDGWHYGVIYVAANEPEEPTENVIYNWSNTEAEQVGITILGAGGKVTVSSTKIHKNQDAIDAVKFEKSYLYADGHYMVIKPAEGAFKAGDSITFSAVFNNANTEGNKFVQVDFYAADGTTRLFRGDSVVNGQLDAADPKVEGFKLEADQDSILIGRYGNTNMFVTLLKVTRVGGDTPEPQDPTVMVFGSMTEPAWEIGIPFELAEDKQSASLTVEHIGAGEYNFKFMINGEWRSNGYRYHRGFPGTAGINENNEANMVFVADQDGEYTFTWFFANDSVAIIYPEKQEPVLENGYYLVGKFGGVEAWNVEDLSAEKLFAVNPDNDSEYQLAINLAEGDELKVVEVENDAIKTWFPNEGGNYVIDNKHNGATTMYFRPNYNGEEGWFANCIYVVPTSETGIDEIVAAGKAAKIVRNGQMLIIKGDKTFNAQGAIVK